MVTVYAALCMVGMIEGVNVTLFKLVAHFDKEALLKRNYKDVLKELVWAMALSVLTVLTSVKCCSISFGAEDYEAVSSVLRLLLLSCINGCFVFALSMDLKVQKVYHFVWWIAGGCSLLLWCLGERTGLVGIIIFGILQNCIFSRFYGRADCHAFTVCAILSHALNQGMEAVWCHMILAYLLLFLIQLIKGNINRMGRLKKPVAFIPYIVCAFWVNIITTIRIQI